ncbi:hypothetical protein TorRG33x02_074900 [Trema orientale]|uniref:Transmembrane protein n=1 Tax=Trema orientale TaxID=63057 RepID=A0A2P5FG87_TREOI|nr:hypothetical protein TorRG33x02_074900 [Trema orientale]
MKREGWRMRETRETKRFLSSLGEGRVKRRAKTASAATTYVSIIHCSAIFVWVSLPLLLLLSTFFSLFYV